MYKYLRMGYNIAGFPIFQAEGKWENSYGKKTKTVVSDAFFVVFCHSGSSGSSVFFSIGRLSLLGIFVFLSIWECNSRYLVCFISVLILTASEGIFGTVSCAKWKL